MPVALRVTVTVGGVVSATVVSKLKLTWLLIS
jgi:hypothetical protein